jgi:hypothetical protein
MEQPFKTITIPNDQFETTNFSFGQVLQAAKALTGQYEVHIEEKRSNREAFLKIFKFFYISPSTPIIPSPTQSKLCE